VPPAATVIAPVAPPPTVEAKNQESQGGWRTEVHGYFRAPMTLGLSSRSNPDEMLRLDENGNPIPDGPSQLQVSHGPNRIMDWSYYSFAYTRLQEQDWAELFFHQKKKHVDAVIGWMGYWYGAAGYRQNDASWLPGMAYLTLDTDFKLAGVKPNLALTMGAFWPTYGYFEKYDTCTLGRFRQIGEQLKLTIPVNPNLTVTAVHGFGTNRDGSYSPLIAATSPLFAGKTGADLLTWVNLQLGYRSTVEVDIGLHGNLEWTRDPYLTEGASGEEGKAYSKAASKAYLAVVGGEASVSVPWGGRLWVSPSYIKVKEGWTLGATGGTEVMHAQGGLGIATNYLAWSGAHDYSTGSGSVLNLGFLYENRLSNLLGKAPGAGDIRLNIFGLLALASLDLPTLPQDSPPSLISQDKIRQFKYGADLTIQAHDWLALMLRGDTVIYDLDNPGFIFSAITGRLLLSSHFLSSETIYLQYSYYIYGDEMKIAGRWPWGVPLVLGSDNIQANKYAGMTPDAHVIKLQAQVTF
jgi:hypothetical protein